MQYQAYYYCANMFVFTKQVMTNIIVITEIIEEINVKMFTI